MAALSPTNVKNTEFSGAIRMRVVTVTLESASDTVDLSSYFGTLYAVIPVVHSGLDAQLVSVACSFSGTTATITSVEQDGTDSTAWGQTVRLLVFGED